MGGHALLNDRSAFLLTAGRNEKGGVLRLTHNVNGERSDIATVEIEANELFLKVTGDYLSYGFHYSVDGRNWQSLAAGVDGKALSPAVVGGYNYTGVYIGLYASSNDAASDNYADFDSFNYQSTAASRDDWFQRQVQNGNNN